ncbi:MAG: hypothetical protein HZA14_02835 [Nitrospirae bacterium]|nr:hypothetical protein [Nitrospirota bacterium]
MSDKSDLERDIELHEIRRTPAGMKILIALLVVSLCALGAYTLSLKSELSKKDREISVTKEGFQKERAELANRIKELETKKTSHE